MLKDHTAARGLQHFFGLFLFTDRQRPTRNDTLGTSSERESGWTFPNLKRDLQMQVWLRSVHMYCTVHGIRQAAAASATANLFTRAHLEIP